MTRESKRTVTESEVNDERQKKSSDLLFWKSDGKQGPQEVSKGKRIKLSPRQKDGRGCREGD